jgi:outer membrane protein OmpA-like peptidoglycan-associated protein
MTPYFARTGGLLLFVGALAGCKFSASASADVKSSGDAQAEARASATDEAGRKENPFVSAIKLKEGKLDYKGVINFEYDKADLRKDSETQATLSEFKKFLAEHPNVNIEIEGHTDSRGSDEYNRDLSDRRAASVKKWLADGGIASDRVTSVGKGEDSPQVPEPDACNDKEPKDTAPCEEPWAKNRRVVFRVTKGAETIPAEPAPAPPPVARAEPEPKPEPESCPWLWGGHLNAFGPNSWINVAGATQPGVCWLELSLGLGLGWGDVSAETNSASGDGDYFSLTVPFRGRFWFMQTHSLIGDAGFGFTHYRMSADVEDDAGVEGEWERKTTPLIAHLGLGYGYRGNGPQAGPRFALVLGGLFHVTKLADSTMSTDAGFVNPGGLQGELDSDSNRLRKFEPYGEVSIGWLF